MSEWPLFPLFSSAEYLQNPQEVSRSNMKLSCTISEQTLRLLHKWYFPIDGAYTGCGDF